MDMDMLASKSASFRRFLMKISMNDVSVKIKRKMRMQEVDTFTENDAGFKLAQKTFNKLESTTICFAPL